MATDLEVMTLRLEANATKFERDMQRAAGMLQKSAKAMEAQAASSVKKIEQNFSGLNTGIVSMATGAFSALAGVLSLRAFVDGADTFIRINNSLKVAGLSAEEANVTFGKLFAIAQATSTPVESLATLYSRTAAAQKSLNASSEDLIRFATATAMALKVNGTSAQEATGALLQLSQALGGGKIQAEEYNSLLDGARPLLQAAADGLKEAGGEIGKLTALVKDGKVSSEAFFRAILAGAGSLQQKIGASSKTFAASVSDLNNALMLLFGTINENLGIIEYLSKLFENAGKNISGFADRLRDVSKQTDINSLTEQLYGAYTVIQKLKAQIENLRSSSNAGAVPVIAQLEKDLQTATDRASTLLDRITTLQGRPATNGPARLQSAYDLAGSTMTDKNAQTYMNDRFGLGSGGTQPVSLKQFPLPPDVAGWQKVIDAQQKSITLLQAEADTVGKTTAERERARLVAELEADAKEKNIPLTGEYRQQIDQLASSYGRLKAQIAFANSIEGTKDRIRDLQQEITLVGLTAGEQERVKVAQQLTNEAIKAGIPLTDARRAQITALADQAGVAATRLEAVNKAQQMLDSMRSELGSVTGAFFNDLANGVKTVDALRNAFTSLRTAILNALGNQLIAALLGAPGTGLGGGLIGGLFGRAGGGAVNAGQPYRVGENGPEMFVPQSAGRIIPSSASGGGAVFNTTINAPGGDVATVAQIHRVLGDHEARIRAIMRAPMAQKRGMS
ncbi:hypothetical protein ABB55_27275 [Prosthecomicrobium hirschii]|uniref:Tape measure protein N-terminal domain-containing protein n=1 Tax=Prosthecodimorpha hirschii TaxID=665126 RepID=A0A0N8GFW8_9HYPH|nr:tape measure protein [Prosthecomicrobium hirschii]KPL55481.1 hypothetical protein ABB55_27275 [Prosthecomicrobium hirschii]